MVERVMILDAVLRDRRCWWLSPEADTRTFFDTAQETGLSPEEYPLITFRSGSRKTVRCFPDKLPIGIEKVERVWEPKFLTEMMAGRDSRVKPVPVPKLSEGLSVADFLDRYCTNYVDAEGLRDPATIKGRLKAVKAVLGEQPASVLEKPSRSSASRRRIVKGARSRP